MSDIVIEKLAFESIQSYSARSAMRTTKRSKQPLKLSLKPQRINPMLWYYEEQGSITVVVDLPELCRRDLQSQPWQVSIPKAKLRRSLARMG